MAARQTLTDRVASWMQTQATHGCLFHAAVASDPANQPLRQRLNDHKQEVAQRSADATALADQEVTLLLILKGLTQS